MKFQLPLLLVIGLLFSCLAYPAPAGTGRAQSQCWSPESEPKINEALAPIAKYGETPAVIAQIHQLIWNNRELIDPRLVYHRILGETFGDPDGTNKMAELGIKVPKGSSAYGMFMFVGKPYGSKKTFKELVLELRKANPHVSPRLLDVRFYYDRILKPAVDAANAHRGCNQSKSWSQYTNLEKVAFLGWGKCDALTLAREKRLCVVNASYKANSCPFSEAAILGLRAARPVCERSTAAHGSEIGIKGDPRARSLK